MLHDQDEAAGGPTPAGKSWHYTNEFARLIFIPYTQETRHMIHQPTTHKKLFLAYFAQLLFLLPLLLCRRYKEKWSPCYSTLCHGISKRKSKIICLFLKNWVLQRFWDLESSEFLRHVSNIMLLCMRYASWLPMLKANSKQPPMDF